MNTEIIQLDENNIEKDKLSTAAEVLKNGGLVAFPTETVYGLGANALDENAVKGIFEAKGRPSDNPLIVHIGSRELLSELAAEVPEIAQKLIEAFWPGPLTMVFKKSPIIPHIITAGLDTVAVRMPAHPVALELIKESGVPVAAPSANVSGRPSPTAAKHVVEDLMGKVDVIIDAGFSQVGLESTVLDISVSPPMLLRPGGVTLSQLRGVIGEICTDPAISGALKDDVKPRSPGMKYTHYAPKAEMIIYDGEIGKIKSRILQDADHYKKSGRKVGILASSQTKNYYEGFTVIEVGNRNMPETIAAGLFASLRSFDEAGMDIILAEAVESDGIGMAIMNRMKKAAGYRIVIVD